MLLAQVEVIRKSRPRKRKKYIPLLSQGKWFGIPPPAHKQNANQPELEAANDHPVSRQRPFRWSLQVEQRIEG